MILAFVFSWLQSCKSFISNTVYFQDTFEARAALEDSEYIKVNFASGFQVYSGYKVLGKKRLDPHRWMLEDYSVPFVL